MSLEYDLWDDYLEHNNKINFLLRYTQKSGPVWHCVYDYYCSTISIFVDIYIYSYRMYQLCVDDFIEWIQIYIRSTKYTYINV